MIINEEEYLEHYGVKGMKWGVRKERRAQNRADYKEARTTMKNVRKSARSSIKSHKKAKTPAERRAAQAKYRKEVLDVIKTPKFREQYAKANSIGKGEMAVRTLMSGPLAPVTYTMIKNYNNKTVPMGASIEAGIAEQVYREMREG